MSIETDFYYSVLIFLKKIKQISLSSPVNNDLCPVITLTFATNGNSNSDLNLFYKCESWRLVEITNSKKDEQRNELTIAAVVVPKFKKVLPALDTILDDPWLSDKNRLIKIHKVLNIKKQKLVIKWSVFILNVESGEATVNNKNHNFNPQEAPFKIFKALLEKKGSNKNDGEVTFEEFTKVTDIDDKEIIKAKIREMRRDFGISRNKNPEEDVFQETGKGYRLITPKSSG